MSLYATIVLLDAVSVFLTKLPPGSAAAAAAITPTLATTTPVGAGVGVTVTPTLSTPTLGEVGVEVRVTPNPANATPGGAGVRVTPTPATPTFNGAGAGVPEDDDDDEQPLHFEFDASNALKTKIYLNPLVPMGKILELSTREVIYSRRDNVSREIVADRGDWFTLVADTASSTTTTNNPSQKKYGLIKNELCDEKDFKIVWYDLDNKLHAPVVQHLGPSPQPWPNAKARTIRVAEIRSGGENWLLLHLDYDASSWQELGLGRDDQKSFGVVLRPVAQLVGCQVLFDRPVPLPTVVIGGNGSSGSDRKTIKVHAEYARHNCTLNVHLTALVFDEENECRQLLQTGGEASARIRLECGQTADLPCPKVDVQTVGACAMHCFPELTLTADYKYEPGHYPKPYVRMSWSAGSAKQQQQQQQQQKGSLVRWSQVDSTFNNRPLGEFNSTVEVLSGTTNSWDFFPFSRNNDAMYSVQVCTVWATNNAGECSLGQERPDWSKVPKRPVLVVELIGTLPAPVQTTTITSSSSSSTTATGVTATPQEVTTKSSKVNVALSSTGAVREELTTVSTATDFPATQVLSEETTITTGSSSALKCDPVVTMAGAAFLLLFFVVTM